MITKKYKAGDINIIAGKGGGDPLTRVDTLPEPNEQTYNENKIYDQNNNLSYIGRDVSSGLKEENIAITSPEVMKYSRGYGNSNFYYTKNRDSDKIYKMNLNDNTFEVFASDPSFTGARELTVNDKYIFIYNYSKKEFYKVDITTKQINKKSVANAPEYSALCVCNNFIYMICCNNSFKGIYKINQDSLNFESISISEFNNATFEWSMCSAKNNLYIYNEDLQAIYKFDTETKSILKIKTINLGRAYSTVMSFNNKNTINIFNATETLPPNNLKFKNQIRFLDVNTNTISDPIDSICNISPNSYGNSKYSGGYFYNGLSYVIRFDLNKLYKFGMFEGITYKSIPVGGGGAEYEMVIVDESQNTNDTSFPKEFLLNDSYKAIFWIVGISHATTFFNKGIIPITSSNFSYIYSCDYAVGVSAIANDNKITINKHRGSPTYNCTWAVCKKIK